MQAFEIRHFRCITGFNQRFETGLDQFHGAAAQHGLFAEQIGLGLFTEVGFDDAGAPAAIAHRVRQRDIARRTRFILVHGDQVRDAATLGLYVLRTVWPGAFGAIMITSRSARGTTWP